MQYGGHIGRAEKHHLNHNGAVARICAVLAENGGRVI